MDFWATVEQVIDVILPVLDEAEAIPGVLAAMPRGFVPLVVDNGSCDGSSEVAVACGARVVREPRRGFGAASFAGLQAAPSDVVCFMDCDGSLDPGELARVAQPVLDETAELRLGPGCRSGERGLGTPAGPTACSRSSFADAPAQS